MPGSLFMIANPEKDPLLHDPTREQARHSLVEFLRAMTGQSPPTTGTALAHIEPAFLSTWRCMKNSWKGFGRFRYVGLDINPCHAQVHFHYERAYPDWRKHPALKPLVGEITDIGLVGCRYRGTIVEFDKIDPSHLRTLLTKCIPIHYQWFSTSTGPFDLNKLGAMDYHSGISLKPQTSLACASRKGKERETSPKRPAGPSQKKRAKYIAVQKKGEEDKGHHISKNEYKRLLEWCVMVHKQLPEGDIFYAYENDAEDEDDAAPAGPIVSAKDLVAHEARMAALPREEPSTCLDIVVAPAVVAQGIVTAEPETSLAVMTQGVMTPGPVNDEPAPVTVTAPIAKAIKVPVVPKPVPDNGAESPVSLGEEEAPFTHGSPIAPCQLQDDHISPMLPSPRAISRPSSPPDTRVVLPAPMDRFTQKPPMLPPPWAMPRPSSHPVLRAVLSRPVGRLAETPAAIEAGRSWQPVYESPSQSLQGESRRDAGSSHDEKSYFRDSYHAYEHRTSRPYQEEGYRSRYLQADSSDHPFMKRKLSSSQLEESSGHTGENKRFCPEGREARRPTLSDRITDNFSTGPSPPSLHSLIDRVSTVLKVPRVEQKKEQILNPRAERKKKQVLNPRAEQVPPLVLRPSMSQVFLQPQELLSAVEGIWLIMQAYQANELQINGPPVFMQGVTFPAAPVNHSGHLITMFQSAIRIAYDLLANPNTSPADSIPTLLRSGATF
ncbi:hypothetical protein F4604DRAFT_1676842 [Suillus subluteus]|nr:hypothetical protein F4604DRAFT_1676842 [Suillus subluteus]